MVALTTPAPSVAACGHPPLPVHIIEAKWPESTYSLVRPYATVLFSVGSNGKVRGVSIVDSSGNPKWDRAALATGNVVAIVEMGLDEHGRVMGLHLRQGVQENADINKAAVFAATRSVFAPAVRSCLPVPAHVDFTATFNG